ncbi:MAG: efflux RND transporter periplasmic adaptor subunit [Eubacteriaceae bacterium]|nr:efflux RND transporter periplasmic adaptor subunit [Eubacteriaceae bacterium]
MKFFTRKKKEDQNSELERIEGPKEAFSLDNADKSIEPIRPSTRINAMIAKVPIIGKLKIPKKWLIIGGAGVAATIAAVSILRPSSGTPSIVSITDITTLVAGDLQSTINVAGTVESSSTFNVISTVNYKVNAIFAKVGYVVEEGDPLCQLDTKELEDQIKQRETALGVSAATAQQQIKTAQDNYNAAWDALRYGTNSSLVSAENAVDNAYSNWQKAQKTYEDYNDQMRRGENAGVMSNEIAYNSARLSYDSAQDALIQAQNDLSRAQKTADNDPNDRLQAAKDDLAIAAFAQETAQADLTSALAEYSRVSLDPTKSQSDIDAAQMQVDHANVTLSIATEQVAIKNQVVQTLSQTTASPSAEIERLRGEVAAKEIARDNAQIALDNAQRQLNAAENNSSTTLQDYYNNANDAYNAYQNALRSYDAAAAAADTSLQASENSLNQAILNSDNSSGLLELALLKDKLDAAEITAPVSGTITAVFAKEGSAGSGLLFVIEDVHSLTVATTIQEYDIGIVKPGMRVAIRSDATPGKVHEGLVSNISPASQKDATGKTITTGDVLFPMEVMVPSPDTGLLIGMSVRLGIVVQEKKNVLSVPYDAVYQKDGSQNYIMVLKEKGAGSYIIAEEPVTIGMETDLYIEVSGPGISSSVQVISIPTNYRELVGKQVSIGNARQSAGSGNRSGLRLGGFR